MLSVAVDLRHVVVVVLARVDEARLHGSADSQVEWEIHDARSRGCRKKGCLIGRAVVDYEDIEQRGPLSNSADDGPDRSCLVIRRHYRQQPPGSLFHLGFKRRRGAGVA